MHSETLAGEGGRACSALLSLTPSLGTVGPARQRPVRFEIQRCSSALLRQRQPDLERSSSTSLATPNCQPSSQTRPTQQLQSLAEPEALFINNPSLLLIPLLPFSSTIEIARSNLPPRADGTSAMAMETRKRSAEDGENEPDAKRQRVENPSIVVQFQGHGKSEHVSALTTAEELARTGLRRGIALALQKVGFDGASPDAMESFVSMAEECRISHFSCPCDSLLTARCRPFLAR
jgi:hypothetical protein